MPNWCENELLVYGEPEALKRFIEFAKGDGAFDFNKFIPYPEKFVEMDRIAREYEKDHPDDWEGRPKDGFNSGGYEWCVANWDTKWNSSNPIVTEGKPLFGKHSLFYSFETAWAPPCKVILAASKQFPELRFVLKYWECGMGFKGTYKVRNGKVKDEYNENYRGHRGG